MVACGLHILFTYFLAHTQGKECAYVKAQADARAGSAERVSRHSSDVRLEPKMGQACSHTSFIGSAHEQQRKEAHFLYRKREAWKAGGK